jgi:threonine/homoserine/homoserine lactone efflux protein
MDVAYAIVFGLALGFSLTIPPGPMNALIAAQAVRSLRAGIITGLGAMSADLVLAILVYGLRSEIALGPVVRWVYLIGAGVMTFLAIRLLRQPARPEVTPESEARTYSQGVLVGLSNPFQIVWWLTAGLAFAYLGGLVLFVALFAAVAIWVVSFPYALHVGTRRRPDVARAVVYVSGAILLAFAIYFVVLAL